ncbi:MAG: GNVR domain-containing protein [Pseudomonadota bacterium]
MNPKQLLLILFAHRYIAVVVFVLVSIGGVVFTLQTPKTYQATTDLLVDSRADPIAGAVTGGTNYLATQIAIIQSERVAIGVVKRLRVAQTPALIEQWKTATQEKIPLENYYANLLRKGLLVEPLRSSNVIRLTFEGTDPKFATAAVNTFAQAYLDLTVDLRVEPVRQYADWFDERLKSLRANVESAQAKLSAYQNEKGIIGIDQRTDQETQRLDALTAQLVAVQGENLAIGSRERNSGGELSPDILASNSVASIKGQLSQAEAKLSEMRISLGPNHPMRIQLEGQIIELKDQLAQEMRRVTGGTTVARTTAGMREAELRGMVAAQKTRVLALRQERDQISVLAQDVEAAKAMYDSVLKRTNQLNLEKQSDQANVSVLSPAIEPNAPSKPNRPKYLAVTFLGALAAALAAALGIEFLNPKVRVVEDLLVDDVPLLGTIERRSSNYSWGQRAALFVKFFTQRKKRKAAYAASRLASLS